MGQAINRLKYRSGIETDLEKVIFSGGVIEELQLKYFKERRTDLEKVLTNIKYNNIEGFKERMDEVENILKQNMGKPEDNSIPSGVITGICPKEEAEVAIKGLNDIADNINALHKQLAGIGLTFDW